MPKTTQQSGLLARMGAKGKKAFNETKGNETTFDTGGSLPAGIENGIAQLTKIQFGTYKSGPNEGEIYFMAMGIVVAPDKHDKIPIAGLHTKIGPEPICDTPDSQGKKKTIADHFDWVTNELRKLGLATADLDFDKVEAACQLLQEVKPYFRFRTWKGQPSEQYPDPRTNEVWSGVCDYALEDDEDVVDDTEDNAEPEDTGDDDLDTAETDDVDLEALAATASDDEGLYPGTKEAGEQLNQIALDAGMSQGDIDAIDTWEELVPVIREQQGDEEEEEEEEKEEEEEEYVPDKSDVVDFKPPKKKNPVTCEVTAVFTKKKTVNLKNLKDGKTVYKGITWDKLLDSE